MQQINRGVETVSTVPKVPAFSSLWLNNTLAR